MTAGFVLMGMLTPEWPLALVVLLVFICAMFVTGGCGTTFALIPFVKRRITGNVAGYTGAFAKEYQLSSVDKEMMAGGH